MLLIRLRSFPGVRTRGDNSPATVASATLVLLLDLLPPAAATSSGALRHRRLLPPDAPPDVLHVRSGRTLSSGVPAHDAAVVADLQEVLPALQDRRPRRRPRPPLDEGTALPPDSRLLPLRTGKIGQEGERASRSGSCCSSPCTGGRNLSSILLSGAGGERDYRTQPGGLPDWAACTSPLPL